VSTLAISMSQSTSLYRRHRPRTFEDVVGQEHVVRTLRNAVTRGMVHHAYLFVGSRGTGKTSMAKILAACLNCERGPTVEPCGVCESCVSIANATSLDVIEMDAASSNSVDDIRDLRDSVAYAPVSGRHKVYILDEAHMLSPQAWNAFLKTLEEPPPNTIFVLATTDPQKVLPTVVDRCHRFDFQRPSGEQIAGVIRRAAAADAVEIPDEAVAVIARSATGSFRDALGTLEQLVTYSGNEIELADVLAVLGVADAELLFEALDAVAAGDARGALLAVGRCVGSGREPAAFIRDLETHARELLVVATLGGAVPGELSVTPERDARLAEQAQRIAPAQLTRLLDLLAAALEALKAGADGRTQLELALVKAATPHVDPSTQALLARLERLEALAGAAAPTAPPPTAPPPRSESPAPAPAPTGAQAVARAVESVAQPAAGAATAVALAEPEPEPGLEPQPAALELETLIALWPAALDLVRERNGMLAAVVADARPVSLADGRLTLAFPDGASFLRKKAEEAHNREAVAAALRATTGHALILSYELREAEPGEATPASEEEWIARLVAEFGAEELEPEASREDDQET
jgi:DNA polymerase III subunit gamma/tau